MRPAALPDHLRGALVVAVDDSVCAREALAFATDSPPGWVTRSPWWASGTS